MITYELTIFWNARSSSGSSSFEKEFEEVKEVEEWAHERYKKGVTIPLGNKTLYLPSYAINLIESKVLT